MKDIITAVICIWLALRIRKLTSGTDERDEPWLKARRSLRWGLLIVLAALSGYFGAAALIHGRGMPTPFLVIITTGLISMIMMGMAAELTGNVIIDSVITGLLIVVACITVVNGIMPALRWLNMQRLCIVLIITTFIALIVRAVFWLNEDNR